jgi:putative oxidoreductase
MQTVDNWNRWANAHTNYFTDGLRILFGIFIMFKGFYLLMGADEVDRLPKDVTGMGSYLILLHYITLAHLCGGFFVVLGLLTRRCSLILLPALIGAVAINFVGTVNASNLVQASLALVACGFFIYYGSGRHSVDYSMRLHE